MARTVSRSDVDRFYASLSGPARFKFYAAIFFLMAPVGLLSSLATRGRPAALDDRGTRGALRARRLGLQPLEALVLQEPRAPPSTLYERIGMAARGFGSQVDDQTVLLVRRLDR